MPASTPIIILPARMASTRLPGKPLADIAGLPMIVQVMHRAQEAGLDAPVLVAAAEPEIAEAVKACGGEAILTDPDLPSGSDRIHQALEHYDPDGRYDTVINVQGDLPTLDPHLLVEAARVLEVSPEADIATLVAEIVRPEERDNPNVVKAITGFAPGQSIARCLYFTRATA
ncbi:MAG: cytidylyltransferase domain-containing protein, partial [Rhodospirillaceae bacterium]